MSDQKFTLDEISASWLGHGKQIPIGQMMAWLIKEVERLSALIDAHKFAQECNNALVCPIDNHTLGCNCDCMTCVNRQRGQAEIAKIKERE